MNPSTYLAPGVFLFLLVVSLSWFVINEQRSRSKLREIRTRAALDRHERMTFVDLTEPGDVVAKPATEEKAPLASRIFGYDVRRLDLYPIHPTVMIVIALPVAILAASIVSALAGKIALVLSVAFWPVVTRVQFGRWQDKRMAVLFKQFPDALAMIVRGVRVGIPVSEAINIVSRESAAPTDGEFGRVGEQLTIGVPLEEALRLMAERNGLPEYRFFATALALQGQTGGNLSETLEGLADTIRKRVSARARGYALAAEARTSANVLTALPLLLFIALWFMNPTYVDTLVTDSAGRMVLGSAIFLLSFGVMAMRMMIRKSLS